jgi:plastocyanin
LLRPSRSLLLAASVAMLLSACSAGSDASAAAADLPEGALAVVGTDRLEFEPDTLEAPAGEITIGLTCEGGVNHNLVIEETDEQVAECRRGQTEVGTVELEPGEYTYVCTIPGHESRMRGTLTVG